MFQSLWAVVGNLPHVVVLDGHQSFQHELDMRGLVPAPQGLGRRLDLKDRVLQAIGVILSQVEPHIYRERGKAIIRSLLKD